jgi:hypothetical protein
MYCSGLAAAACLVIGFADGAGAQAIRDSAGIRLVTHARAARPASTWRIDPTPLVEVGGADGMGPKMFSHILGAARLPNGDIVVSDEPAQELRVFDSQGRHVRTFGRRGRGPGEFAQIRGVVIRRDTIYAMDDTQGTAVFTLDGKLVRQVPYPSIAPYHAVDPWGVLADGSVIEGAAPRETMAMVNQVGTRIEMRGLVRIAPDSRSSTVLAEVPSYEYHRAAGDPPGGDMVAFAPFLSVAVLEDRVCTGRGVRYEITCMSPSGKAQLIIRRDVAPVPVNAAAREAYLKRITTPFRAPGMEGGPVRPEVLAARAARTRFAENFPAFDWIMPGKDGELWVSEYRPELKTLPRGEQPPAGEVIRWDAFDREGRWIGAVDLPAAFVPKDIGRDYVLGVNRDEDGVPRATMYRLRR